MIIPVDYTFLDPMSSVESPAVADQLQQGIWIGAQAG
jgi:hypothetical protein